MTRRKEACISFSFLCARRPLKKAHVDAEGTLRAAYWSGNDALRGEAVDRLSSLDGVQGFVVDGHIELPAGGSLTLAANGSTAACPQHY